MVSCNNQNEILLNNVGHRLKLLLKKSFAIIVNVCFLDAGQY
jgi:hypothetical protein